MKNPMDADFTVTPKDGSVRVVFAPTESYYDFSFLVDAEDIEKFGPLSPVPHVRHAKTGDTGKYVESEVQSAAHRLAVKGREHITDGN